MKLHSLKYTIATGIFIIGLSASQLMAQPVISDVEEYVPPAAPVQEQQAVQETQPAPEAIVPESFGNLRDVLDDEGFDEFLSYIDKAGMKDILTGAQAHTLFVPNDRAFSKLPSDTKKALSNDIEKVKDILSYHVVVGKIPSAQFDNNTSEVMTMTLKRLGVVGKDGKLSVNGFEVKEEFPADNGVIYEISDVILTERVRTPIVVEEKEISQEAKEALRLSAPTPENVPVENAEASVAVPAPEMQPQETEKQEKKPFWKFW